MRIAEKFSFSNYATKHSFQKSTVVTAENAESVASFSEKLPSTSTKKVSIQLNINKSSRQIILKEKLITSALL